MLDDLLELVQENEAWTYPSDDESSLLDVDVKADDLDVRAEEELLDDMNCDRRPSHTSWCTNTTQDHNRSSSPFQDMLATAELTTSSLPNDEPLPHGSFQNSSIFGARTGDAMDMEVCSMCSSMDILPLPDIEEEKAQDEAYWSQEVDGPDRAQSSRHLG